MDENYLPAKFDYFSKLLKTYNMTNKEIKDDFQSALRCLSFLMFINILKGHSQLAHMHIRHHFVANSVAYHRDAIHTVFNQI